jgi:hypothetical protein
MRKFFAYLVVACLTVLCFAPAVFAVAQDYSDIGTSAALEVAAVMPEALTLFGLIFGVPLAIKLLRRVAR